MVNPTLILLLLIWLYTLQAVAGIGVTIWAAIDAYLDYRTSCRAHRVQLISDYDQLENVKVAQIGALVAVAGLIAHSLFLSFGVYALSAPVVPPRTLTQQLYQYAFVLLQSVMLGCQIWVQLLRRQLRHLPPCP